MNATAAEDAGHSSGAGGSRRSELASGWPVLLAVLWGSGVGPTVLVPYTAGVFIPALQAAFGWTRGMSSFGVTMFLALTAVMAPLAGAIADRRGVRLMLPLSMLATSIAFFMLSLLEGEYWLFLVVLSLLGIFGAGASTLIMSRILTNAFDQARGTALGIGLLGIGITGMLAPAVLSAIAQEEGWRSAYRALALLSLLSLPFVCYPVWRQERSSEAARRADMHRHQPAPRIAGYLGTPIFWKLAAAFFLVQVSITGLLVHFIPLLNDRGVPAVDAAFFAGIIGGVMIISRLAVGIIIDRFFAPRVAFIVTAASAGGVGLLAIGDASMAPFGAFAVGLVIGAEFDLAAYMVSRYFPTSAFGRIYGVLFTVMVMGTLTSTSAYGFWSDWAGGYGQVLIAATGGLCLASIIFLTLPSFSRPSTAGVAEPSGQSALEGQV
jgi:MFS family permease